MDKKYFLHRISHEDNVSYSLLEKGYLTIGWEKFADTEVMNAAREKGYDHFNQIMEEKNEKNRARWSMWYFAQMKKEDTVVVPLYDGLFSVYRVKEQAVPIYALDGLVDDIEGHWKHEKITWNNKRLYNGESLIDLGFAIHVEPIAEKVLRRNVEGRLISRMKIRSTNADITDIKEHVESAIKVGQTNQPITLYEKTIESLQKTLKETINTTLDDIKFEQLIKWYLEKCGANFVWIPPKNQSGKEDGADADVIAEFENLKYIVYVQAKHHVGTTDDWAVKQIASYVDQKNTGDPAYTYATWVVSSADQFSEEAEKAAAKNGVRLIDGKEFARMLLNIGLLDIDDAFSVSSDNTDKK